MTESRVALVTGAAHGIGAGIAARLARDGWRVVGVDKTAFVPPAFVPPAFVPPAFAPPGGITVVVADIADEAAVAALMTQVADVEGRLDALVSNAGIMVRKPLRDLTLAEWSAVIATNLTATFLLARAAERMLRASHGSITTIASTRAHMSEPDTESYAASKGGLLALTHALAVSLGPEIRVNVISPGWIDVGTDPLRPEDHAQHPAGRVGRVEDVAAMAAWLAGPESGFVTGAEFIIDGGMTRKMIYAE